MICDDLLGQMLHIEEVTDEATTSHATYDSFMKEHGFEPIERLSAAERGKLEEMLERDYEKSREE